jgi:hypothetical protein
MAVSREWLEPVWAAGAAGQRPDWADVEWYALDEDDCVGMLTSGGMGPIPRTVFRGLETHLALASWLDNLPPRGSHELLIRYPDVTDYAQAADRGLFAFDYESEGPAGEGYRLVARPSAPLLLNALPKWAQDWLEDIRLDGVRFVESAGRILDLSHVRSGLVS